MKFGSNQEEEKVKVYRCPIGDFFLLAALRKQRNFY